MRTVVLLAFALLVAGCVAPEAPGATMPPAADTTLDARAFGDARVLARAPDRWHVEGITYRDGLVYASTAFGATGDPLPLSNAGQPSRIFVHDRATGALVETIVVQGEDTTRPHGLTGMTTDASGRLYALSSQLGLLRWTNASGERTMERVAQLPDVRPCALAQPPCSPTGLRDEPPIGNDLTWGPDGALYVSDSFQASVWRIDPTGAVTQWFAHESLDRRFGPNGLRVSPNGTRLLLAVSGPDSFAAGPLQRPSVIVSIPFPDPKAGAMETTYALPNGEYADGIAYGAKGDLYVLSNAGDRIHILPADGGRPRIVSNADLKGEGRMAFPASLVFDGTGAVLIANYAYADGAVRPEGRTVIDVFVDDAGAPFDPPAGIAT